ncbi:MAG: zinc-ribbon domain-containing protein [Bacteriovoracaceae bacterium]|jgi:uncharacterized protein with PQ loop repeat|nr:zinc-ribbon domain-containing protein [Bacteriovoracaceae bacterium]
MERLFFEYASWIALLVLSIGYWVQAIKIHHHKEVRDLSFLSYLMLTISFIVVATHAAKKSSTTQVLTQVASAIPCLIIMAQIWYHKEDRWHDDENGPCQKCGNILEPSWSFCTNCGEKLPTHCL